MRVLFYLGWVLLLGAFATAAAEAFVASLGRPALLVPAHDLWYAVSPRTLVLSQIHVERIAPWLWDPVVETLLRPPAWALLGVPGAALTWFCRPNRIMRPEVREEYERQAESLFVIDDLTRSARKDETWDPREDDSAPVHLLFDIEREAGEDTEPGTAAHDIPAGYPGPDFYEDWDRGDEEVDLEAMVGDDRRPGLSMLAGTDGDTADDEAEDDGERDTGDADAPRLTPPPANDDTAARKATDDADDDGPPDHDPRGGAR